MWNRDVRGSVRLRVPSEDIDLRSPRRQWDHGNDTMQMEELEGGNLNALGGPDVQSKNTLSRIRSPPPKRTTALCIMPSSNTLLLSKISTSFTAFTHWNQDLGVVYKLVKCLLWLQLILEVAKILHSRVSYIKTPRT